MTCPHCGETLAAGVNFCEHCGRAMAAAYAAPLPYADAPDGAHDSIAPSDPTRPDPGLDEAAAGSVSTPTVRHAPRGATPGASPGASLGASPGASLGASPESEPERRCRDCQGEIDGDSYCTQCGLKAPSARDHFTSAPAAWVAGVCDRGRVHERNEDAMAVAAEGEMGGRAVLVVCDGVSSSDDSDVASMAAATAALEVLRPPMPRGLGIAASADLAAARVFAQAAQAANTAVIAATAPGSARPASCTFIAAVVEGATIRYAGLGDSRAYWLPDGQAGRTLLADDSVAQEFIAAGMPREQAEVTPQAHAITKWLGVDSPDIEPRVGAFVAEGPGWLLVCSDGLWNYASEPDLLAHRIEASGSFDPVEVANSLVEWANSRGGRDNITVTLARIDPSNDDDGPTVARPNTQERGSDG